MTTDKIAAKAAEGFWNNHPSMSGWTKAGFIGKLSPHIKSAIEEASGAALSIYRALTEQQIKAAARLVGAETATANELTCPECGYKYEGKSGYTQCPKCKADRYVSQRQEPQEWQYVPRRVNPGRSDCGDIKQGNRTIVYAILKHDGKALVAAHNATLPPQEKK